MNTLGPVLVTSFYLFIVGVYLVRPSVNDVAPAYLINARGVFYIWLILSVFLLDWVLQYPTITPERMNLAIYKLFGEVAIAMMASGFGEWTKDPKGLDPVQTLVPGQVSWVIVHALMAVWTFVTILPNMWVFTEKRWAATLDGFEMFRLGAEWQEMVWEFDGEGFKKNENVLLDVPGMIGDMEPNEKRGFKGLSYRTARLSRDYGYDRSDLS